MTHIPFRHPLGAPRIVFFSGGTALASVAQTLMKYTKEATYIMTPFDSGGSSAILRSTFTMPAIGDFRARLISLTNPKLHGYEAITTLFRRRFPLSLPQGLPQALTVTPPSSDSLRKELHALAQGKHPLIEAIPFTQQGIFLRYIRTFCEAMPPTMPLHNASFGNIILTGAYLWHEQNLAEVIKEFTNLLQTQGHIHAVASTRDTHLCVRLENGEIYLGQHSFTGKCPHATSSISPIAPIPSPIKDIWLTQSLEDATPIQVNMAEGTDDIIKQADLICYPIGSFYSSVIANLLPQGISEALVDAPCPKVFIPNICTDPELCGQSLQSQIISLVQHARLNKNTKANAVLNAVLIDTDTNRYSGGIPCDWLAEQGIAVHQTNLVSEQSAPCIDAEHVCVALMDLCR